MTSETLIIALLTATALLLSIGWIAVIISILVTVRRVNGVVRAIEHTAESVRSSAQSKRPMWHAVSSLWRVYKRSRKD